MRILIGQHLQEGEVMSYFNNRIIKLDLPKRISLFYVEPFPSESLNSWINRLAHSHYTGLNDFLFKRVNQELTNKVDFDTFKNSDGIRNLLYQIPLYSENLVDLTLNNRNYLFYSQLLNRSLVPWLFPHVGSQLKRGNNFGLQYCPCCWGQDEKQFFRIGWRLSFNFFCSECFHYLRSFCPICHKGIVYSPAKFEDFREDVFNGFRYCFNCGFDLVKAEIKVLSPEDFDLANRIVTIIKGQYDLPCSIQDYLIVLHYFTQRAFKDYLRLNSPGYIIQRRDRVFFLECDADLRAQFIREAFCVFDSFPKIMNYNLRAGGFNKAFWLRGFKEPNEWYIKQVESFR